MQRASRLGCGWITKTGTLEKYFWWFKYILNIVRASVCKSNIIFKKCSYVANFNLLKEFIFKHVVMRSKKLLELNISRWFLRDLDSNIKCLFFWGTFLKRIFCITVFERENDTLWKRQVTKYKHSKLATTSTYCVRFQS